MNPETDVVTRAREAQAIVNETRQAAISQILQSIEESKKLLIELGYRRTRKKLEAPAKKRGRPPKVQATATE